MKKTTETGSFPMEKISSSEESNFGGIHSQVCECKKVSIPLPLGKLGNMWMQMASSRRHIHYILESNVRDVVDVY